MIYLPLQETFTDGLRGTISRKLKSNLDMGIHSNNGLRNEQTDKLLSLLINPTCTLEQLYEVLSVKKVPTPLNDNHTTKTNQGGETDSLSSGKITSGLNSAKLKNNKRKKSSNVKLTEPILPEPVKKRGFFE
jgi:hypothetical protein